MKLLKYKLMTLFMLVLLSLAGCREKSTQPQTHEPPTQPQFTFTFLKSDLWSGINDVAVAGNYAYCAMKYGVMILDISNPQLLRVASYLRDLPGGGALSIRVAGTYAYVANGNAGLIIVNIANPTRPSIVGSLDVPDFIQQLELTGKYAILRLGEYYSNGFLIVDITNSTAPSIAGYYKKGMTSYYATEKYVYVMRYYYPQLLEIVDISNPASPDSVGGWTLKHRNDNYRVSVKDNYVYISYAWDNNLDILDVSTPSTPVKIKSFQLQQRGGNIALNGEHLYISSSSFQIVDVSNPTDPVIKSVFDLGDNSKINISCRSIDNGHAAITYGQNDLQILNIADPSNPINAGEYDGGIVYNITIARNYAYAACGYAGLKIMSLSNPASPNFVACLPTGTEIFDAMVVGNYAYLATRDGLQVINVSNPSAPIMIGYYKTPDIAKGIDMKENIVYLAAGFYGGLQIINVELPSSPTLIGSYDTPGDAIDLAVSGNYAYVADGTYRGLQIINISNPTSPTFAGRYDTLGNTNNISIVGKYAYVSDGALNILVSRHS